MKLNSHQLQAVRHKSGPLLIIAGAGTGKTTVITERIKYLIQVKKVSPQHILAVTFTDKAAREMLERLDVVMPLGYQEPWLSTFHHFCDRILRAEGLSLGLDPDFTILSTAEQWILIKQHLFDFKLNYYRPLGNPTKFISALVTFFSRAQDEAVDPHQLIKFAQKHKTLNLIEVARAYHTYQDLKVKHSVLDFGDLINYTINLFRSRPEILAKYKHQFQHILVDEFQDTNFAQYQLIKFLAPSGSAGSAGPNLVVVADDDQCLPTGTKITIPSGQTRIENIKKGDRVITAVGKGYTSASIVSAVIKSTKNTRLVTLKTESGKEIITTDNHKMFCLIPGRKYGAKRFFYVYLMQRRNLGWRMGITDDIAQRLKLERSADKIIAIKACDTEEEARYCENTLSLQYGIPLYPFKARKHMMLTGQWLKKLFTEIDTESHVKKLAHDLGIDLNSHHFCLGGVVRGDSDRVKVILRMCVRRNRTLWARNRLLINPTVLHEVRLETSSPLTLKKLRKTDLKLLKAKKGWQVKKSFTNLTEAGEFAQYLIGITDAIFEAKFDVGKRDGLARQALVMPAGNIFPGMRIPILKGYEVIYEQVVSRKDKLSTATVYDLEIDKTHNFIANDVVVHNSIYKWRGAALSNVLNFKAGYPKAKVVSLVKNYRSLKPILTAAYNLIQHNNPDRLEVKLKINKKLRPTRHTPHSFSGVGPQIINLPTESAEVDWIIKRILELVALGKYTYKDFAILTRANSQLEPFVAALRRHGLPYQLIGNRGLFDQEAIRQLLFFLKTVVNPHDSLSLFQLLHHPKLALTPPAIFALIHQAHRHHSSLWDILHQSPRTYASIIDLVTQAQAQALTDSPTKILYTFLQATDYIKYLVDQASVDSQLAIQNINLFLDLVKRFEADLPPVALAKGGPTLLQLVDFLSLLQEAGANPAQAEIEDIDTIRLITVHSAKGLEFPVVFIPSLVAGRFPAINRRDPIEFPDQLVKETLPAGDTDVAEERRLFYVGLTRARDYLYLTYAQNYGGVRDRKPSGFLAETKLSTITPAVEPFTPRSPAPPDEVGPAISLPRHFKLTSLSYSQIDTFKACPLKYKYRYVLKVPAAPHHALTFGQSLHDTLRHFHQLELQGSKPTLKDLLRLYAHHFNPTGYTSAAHRHQRFLSGKKALRQYFSVYRQILGRPLELEKSFHLNIAGVPLVGKIDRIDQTDTGLAIVDYKTGQSQTKKQVDIDDQLTIYALGAKQTLGLNVDSLSLYFLESNQKISTTRSATDLSHYHQHLKQIVHQIKTSDFPATPGSPFPCDFCEYNSICPFAAKKR